VPLRLYNTIGVDAKRAPLILKAFELYASGDYTIERLEAAMADLGLTTRPSPRWPRKQPVGNSKLHQMLSDPYYAGWVKVDGRLVPGRHEGIVSQTLFDHVQDVLAARSGRGSRDRVLYHYLKGMLFCDRCDRAGRTARLIYTEAKGRNGQYYGYFLCRARQEGGCDLPHLPAWQVEDAIARNYRNLQVPADFAGAVREQVEATIAEQQTVTRELHHKLTEQLRRLELREQRLIDLAADGMLDRTKILERSNAIQLERRRIEASLTDTSAELRLGAERLAQCLALVADPAKLYANAPEHQVPAQPHVL
jgi:site-specific DNA recombinase